ncbi:MAG TPA: hypothetical protein VEJ41_08170 [Candidatus Acidoferrales bacterium]|nr:hypothetical protein [Candidatus Acidoferrales bacterium]
MDTELTPALERVAASVVETNRRRKQLEDELAAASAAVASLQHQSTSLESSMVDLRRQLEGALEARARDDLAVEQLVQARSEVIERSDALRAEIEKSLLEKTEAQSALQSHIESTRRALALVDADVKEVKTLFARIAKESERVHEALTHVRHSADTAQAALADIDSKTRELDAATDSMAARVCRIAESVEQVDRNEKQMRGASDGLADIAARLEARKIEAESAAEEVLALSKDRQASAVKIAEHLARLDELCTQATTSTNGGPPLAPEPVPSPPEAKVGAKSSAPARFDGTLATLELLGGQGLITPAEAAAGAELLHDGGVDKLVRAWWSRAMGGPAPGYYRVIIGQALAESSDAKGALTFFNRAMEGKPVDPFITYLVARALLALKRYVDVLRIAAALGRTRHGKALALNIEALHSAGGRHYDEAEAKLTQALATPGLAKLHYNETLYNLATLAEAKGDPRAAAAWFDKLRTMDPTYRGIANHIASGELPVGAL